METKKKEIMDNLIDNKNKINAQVFDSFKTWNSIPNMLILLMFSNDFFRIKMNNNIYFKLCILAIMLSFFLAMFVYFLDVLWNSIKNNNNQNKIKELYIDNNLILDLNKNLISDSNNNLISDLNKNSCFLQYVFLGLIVINSTFMIILIPILSFFL